MAKLLLGVCFESDCLQATCLINSSGACLAPDGVVVEEIKRISHGKRFVFCFKPRCANNAANVVAKFAAGLDRESLNLI